jgi:hypothetical protein
MARQGSDAHGGDDSVKVADEAEVRVMPVGSGRGEPTGGQTLKAMPALQAAHDYGECGILREGIARDWRGACRGGEEEGEEGGRGG